MNMLERFIKYVSFDTMSSETSTTYPSTASQLEFGKLLVEELHQLGIDNAYQDEYGLVYASLDGDESLPKIGLIAHMDTSPSLQGGNFTPRLIESYAGEDIILNEKYTLSPKQFPSLKKNIGEDLLVTDGEHLLGGDDKAGLTIIMEILEYYTTHKDIKHSPIRVCFTPDEEVGQGALHFDVKKMDADFAYTLDGGCFSDINYENFNAASAQIDIYGVGVHPGSAKGIMINACLLGCEINSALPLHEIPQDTDGYEGFYHLTSFNGDTERATLSYILRDHDEKKLEKRINRIQEICSALCERYPSAKINLETKYNYKNMRTYFDEDMSCIERVVTAYKACGVSPTFSPIRGGTDGATITFMGLPCPNLGTGDYNCHGRFEYVSLTEMAQMVEVIKALLENTPIK